MVSVMNKGLMFLVASLLLACAKPLPEGYIKPSVRLSGPRMVRVDEVWGMTVLLYGDYPREELGIEVSAGNDHALVPFIRGLVDWEISRVYQYRLKFTHNFYWRLWFEHKDGMLGRGTLFRPLDAGCMESNCPWDEWVFVEVRICRVEILPGGGIKMGKTYASMTHRIKLECYDCMTEELRG